MWQHITMDFITKLPKIARGFDTNQVIIDRLTKSAHLIYIHEISSTVKLDDIYVREIISHRGMSTSVVFD